MRLAFEQGTVTVDGEYTVPHTKRDDRTGNDRALVFRYRDIHDYLTNSEITYEDTVLDLIPAPELTSDIELRPYQQEALDRWLTEYRGVLVLPTGATKPTSGCKLSKRSTCRRSS